MFKYISIRNNCNTVSLNSSVLALQSPGLYQQGLRAVLSTMNNGDYDKALDFADSWIGLDKQTIKETTTPQKRKRRSTTQKRKAKKRKKSTNKKKRTGDVQKRVKKLFSNARRMRFEAYGFGDDERDFCRSLYRQHFIDDGCDQEHEHNRNRRRTKSKGTMHFQCSKLFLIVTSTIHKYRCHSFFMTSTSTESKC
jgi:hypothetical protein